MNTREGEVKMVGEETAVAPLVDILKSELYSDFVWERYLGTDM